MERLKTWAEYCREHGLGHGQNPEVRAEARRLYRREYMKQYKQQQRSMKRELVLYLSKGDYRALNAEAKRYGMKVGAYMLRTCLAQANKAVPHIPPQIAELLVICSQIQSELRFMNDHCLVDGQGIEVERALGLVTRLTSAVREHFNIDGT